MISILNGLSLTVIRSDEDGFRNFVRKQCPHFQWVDCLEIGWVMYAGRSWNSHSLVFPALDRKASVEMFSFCKKVKFLFSLTMQRDFVVQIVFKPLLSVPFIDLWKRSWYVNIKYTPSSSHTGLQYFSLHQRAESKRLKEERKKERNAGFVVITWW